MRVHFTFLFFFALGLLHAHAEEARPYRNPNIPTQERVHDLLSRMTLEEKVGQMTQVNVTRLMGSGEWDRGPLDEGWVEHVLRDNHVGSLLSGGGAAPVPNTPRAWAEMVNELQRYAIENSRLGIPIIYGVDAVHGHNNVLGATIFPHNHGLAATWNLELARKVAEHTARDVRATGIHWTFAPVADLGRDPRWGRFYETFGKDPLLVSRFVAASVEGFQAEGVAATVKHFVGYGEPLTGRDRTPAFLDPRSLVDAHLPPFRAGIEAGAMTAMANSGSLNGVPVHASRYLLEDLLRGELGFAGLTVSDWNDVERLHTVHGVAETYEEAIAMSIMAGIDMVMVPHDAEGFTSRLVALVAGGRVSEERIDEAVRRILTVKFELGLFENPFVDAAEAVRLIERERTLAREAALQSLTLLKNDGVLPLESVPTVLVTGPAADSVAMQMGGWTIGWQGVEREEPPAVTILEGLRAGAPAGTEVVYHPINAGLDLLREAARAADVAVVALGEPPYAEGMGDSETLALPEAQVRLLRELIGLDTPLIAVLYAGRPLVLEGLLDELDALVMAYLPGSEAGGALAEVLFGRASPSGRLPFSWPRRVGQLPIDYDHLPSQVPYEPLFAFGYGLSYTSFRYEDVRASVSDNGVELSLALGNEGEMAGHEVVQVYLEGTYNEVMMPTRRLVGFEKVHLEPGETRAVVLELPLERFATSTGDVFDVTRAVKPGTYVLEVGGERVSVSLGR